MDLERLYAGSFVDWERVATSWAKRTVSSRLLLFAARRYLAELPSESDPAMTNVPDPASLPGEVRQALASPPDPSAREVGLWGEFVDAAVGAELEVISYGERPPLLHELRAGLEQASGEAGPRTELGRWFLARREALPGTDLPDDPAFLPV